MRNGRRFGLLVIPALLMSCGSSTPPGPLLGPDTTLAEADALAIVFFNDTLDLFEAEGGPTLSELPITPVTYRGFIAGGEIASEDFVGWSHFADMTLDLNLVTAEVSGTISNFKLEQGPISNPGGVIEVDGGVTVIGGIAGMSFFGSGPLETPEDNLSYEIWAQGIFVGADGARLLGEHTAAFILELGGLPFRGEAGGILAAKRD